MKLDIVALKKSLNKAYLKEKVGRSEIENFKKNISDLFDRINEEESEEHLKNLVSDFLKKTWYKEAYEINTKGRQDLVIHTGRSAKEPVGVILEVKRPSNKIEMMSEKKPNTKAMHELILYYLRERIELNNIDIKYLVVTNIYEWYILDEVWFEVNVFRNSRLIKAYESWKLSGKDTRFFYESIASPLLDEMTEDIPCAFFDIREFYLPAISKTGNDDVRLIALYKILSPAHLLKQAFSNDSNSLDTKFYSELLNIIGLEEINEGTKRLIKRKEKPEAASLLENAIIKLEDKDCLRNLSQLSNFGSSRKEQLFSIALELCITWINRVLFLKLLEAQLFKFHNGDKNYLFLNARTILDYDQLNNLFFQVLAEKSSNRHEHLKEKFEKVPYLNSSLFERTELERQTIDIGDLDHRLLFPLFSATVLKDSQGKKRAGKVLTLQYLFEFLDSYDFTSEGSEEIQEENKNLINASVLGLIFEKINGYKDGSFFTPGFITMYICKETIRRIVIQKFNDRYQINCDSFDDLKNFVCGRFKTKDILEFNSVINELRICDPAVGSGHFLVSALNEIIAVKAELGILADKEGSRLTAHEVKIENDELIVTYNNDTEIFAYTVTNNSVNKESQRIQKTLFHEKETLIENCLFGVDINSNSVKICRLRLWIELLKSAYYKEESMFTELETLPNIDINIKCGNSLISRFPMDIDLSAALKKNKSSVADYRQAVHKYHSAETKEQKRSMEKLIDSIKGNYRTEITIRDPKVLRKNNLMSALQNLNYSEIIELSAAEKKVRKQKEEKLESQISELAAEIEEIRNNKVYENATEWRLEFPEVLNGKGEFVGFDLILGNPPYLNFKMYSQSEKSVFKENFINIFDGKADLYYFFFAQGLKLLKQNGILCYITSRYWLEAEFAEKLRKDLANLYSIKEIIDFKNVTIFDGIGIKTSIATIQKTSPKIGLLFQSKHIDSKKIDSVNIREFTSVTVSNDDIRSKAKWVFGEPDELGIYEKIESNSILLETVAHCKQGIVTGLDKAFITSENDFSKIPKKYVKTWVKVGDIHRYSIVPVENRHLVYTNEIEKLSDFPELEKRLKGFKEKLSERREAKSGKIRWFDLQWARDPELFNSHKLICRFKASQNTFSFDENKCFSSADTTIVVMRKEYSDKFDIKYLLALVNSKLLDFYFKSYGKLMDYRFEYYPGPVGQLRIKDSDSQADFVKLVDKIIDIKKIDPQKDTSAYEGKIDQMVYSLFGLDKNEIRIVEGA